MNYINFSLEDLPLPIAICDGTSPMTSIEADAYFGSLLARRGVEFTWENNLYTRPNIKTLNTYKTIVFDTLFGDQQKFLQLTNFDKNNLELVITLSWRSFMLAKSLKEKLNLNIKILGFDTMSKRGEKEEFDCFFNPEETTPEDW